MEQLAVIAALLGSLGVGTTIVELSVICDEFLSVNTR